jgi:hypothetical protein
VHLPFPQIQSGTRYIINYFTFETSNIFIFPIEGIFVARRSVTTRFRGSTTDRIRINKWDEVLAQWEETETTKEQAQWPLRANFHAS